MDSYYKEYISIFYEPEVPSPEKSIYLGICRDHISFGNCNGNGTWKGKGTCYRCAGKGKQNLEDIYRNRIYDFFNPKYPEILHYRFEMIIREKWKKEDVIVAYCFQQKTNDLFWKGDYYRKKILNKQEKNYSILKSELLTLDMVGKIYQEQTKDLNDSR